MKIFLFFPKTAKCFFNYENSVTFRLIRNDSVVTPLSRQTTNTVG